MGNFDGVYYAVHNDELEGLKYSISKGVDINERQGMILNTSIMTATNTKSTNLIKWILDNGANPNLLTKSSREIVNRYGTEELKDLKYVLTSGAKNFDETLGGGFYKGKKYLIFGSNKTGKTQLCHQLCVQAYIQLSRLNEKSKIMNKQFVFYFDTENTFRPERLKELIKTRNLDYDRMLKCIFVSKIMSNTAFILKLDEVEDILENNDIKMLIIDSINNYYRLERGDKKISFFKFI